MTFGHAPCSQHVVDGQHNACFLYLVICPESSHATKQTQSPNWGHICWPDLLHTFRRYEYGVLLE
jgi:hypothetical protein